MVFNRLQMFRQGKHLFQNLFKSNTQRAVNITRVLFAFQILVPGTMNRELVYWMLDCREITTEMVHEHFLEILHLFPVLVSRLETKNLSCPPRPLHSLEPAPRSTAQIKPEVKFNGPFSIDSILKRDFTSAQAYTPTLSLPVRVEHFTQPTQRRTGTKRCFGWDTDQHLILQASAGCSPVCTGGGSTHHWATADGTTTPVKRIPVYSVPSLQVHPGAVPLFTSPQSSGLTYALPALTPGVPRF